MVFAGFVKEKSSRSKNDRFQKMQIDALLEAGADPRHLFEEKISARNANRPKLKETLAFLEKGDILVVWKLDRLGRSLQDLIQIIKNLKEKGVGFQSLSLEGSKVLGSCSPAQQKIPKEKKKVQKEKEEAKLAKRSNMEGNIASIFDHPER